VEWPDDELAVYSSLRGPFFALTDSTLLEYRSERKTLNPLAPRLEQPSTPDQNEVAQALDLLKDAFKLRNERPLAHTVQALLSATRAHAGMAFWPSGEQALANVQRIVDEARRFDARAATSFRAFVERLQEQARRGEASGANVLEEGSDGVRIMTVHGAKGLEHPIVILCEPTQGLRTDPSRYVDVTRRVSAVPLCDAAPYELRRHRDELLRREHAEETRLTYVAATRARDLLVVPCVGDARQLGWVDVLHPALYPAPETKRAPAAAPGCPAFGDDSVLDAPARAQRNKEDSVAPGEHIPQRGEHRVVWWDPRTLMLDRVPVGGVRQQELLAPSQSNLAELASKQRYELFEVTRSSTLERASVALLRASTITTLARQPTSEPVSGLNAGPSVPAVPVAVEIVTRAKMSSTAAGARFGTLVHAVLADLLAEHVRGGDVRPERFVSMIAWHARALGASVDETESALSRVAAAWDHAVLVRARASDTLWIELPVALRLESDVLAEGALDLAFREADGTFTVVDLKTDDPTGNASYAAQVALYARAIAVATGQVARGLLLAV
jgi:ATP-dependent exoDNAse (exonuclease V) beta subunit